MQKIAVGREARDVINLEAPVKENIVKVAKALGKDIGEVTVSMLDRPRHEALIQEVRETGARIRLVTDGDVAIGVATCLKENPIDMLLGSGGSTEGVLTAVAVKILGGQIFAKFAPRNDEDRKALAERSIKETDIFSADDLARGNDPTFTATGVIDGPLLPGVVFESESIITHSLMTRVS